MMRCLGYVRVSSMCVAHTDYDRFVFSENSLTIKDHYVSAVSRIPKPKKLVLVADNQTHNSSGVGGLIAAAAHSIFRGPEGRLNIKIS